MPHCYFIIWLTQKNQHFLICLPAFLDIHRNQKQKLFWNITFWGPVLTVHCYPSPFWKTAAKLALTKCLSKSINWIISKSNHNIWNILSAYFLMLIFIKWRCEAKGTARRGAAMAAHGHELRCAARRRLGVDACNINFRSRLRHRLAAKNYSAGGLSLRVSQASLIFPVHLCLLLDDGASHHSRTI
jgi:hypothetical protein